MLLWTHISLHCLQIEHLRATFCLLEIQLLFQVSISFVVFRTFGVSIKPVVASKKIAPNTKNATTASRRQGGSAPRCPYAPRSRHARHLFRLARARVWESMCVDAGKVAEHPLQIQKPREETTRSRRLRLVPVAATCHECRVDCGHSPD